MEHYDSLSNNNKNKKIISFFIIKWRGGCILTSIPQIQIFYRVTVLFDYTNAFFTGVENSNSNQYTDNKKKILLI